MVYFLVYHFVGGHLGHLKDVPSDGHIHQIYRLLLKLVHTFSITGGYSRHMRWSSKSLTVKYFIAGKGCLCAMPTGFSWLSFSSWCTSFTQPVMSRQTTCQTPHSMLSQEKNLVTVMSCVTELYLRRFYLCPSSSNETSSKKFSFKICLLWYNFCKLLMNQPVATFSSREYIYWWQDAIVSIGKRGGRVQSPVTTLAKRRK